MTPALPAPRAAQLQTRTASLARRSLVFRPACSGGSDPAASKRRGVLPRLSDTRQDRILIASSTLMSHSEADRTRCTGSGGEMTKGHSNPIANKASILVIAALVVTLGAC